MEPLEADDPRQAGPYTLLGRLGAGGMGAVYLGRSAGGRTVAVKLVKREFAADEDFRARFRREVEAARAVSGAFTASVVDADTEAAMPWLATTFVPGVPLSAAVRKHGGFGEPVLRALGVGLAEALQEIHRAGVIHRDLKPANVMLAADGPHVIDFGISRAVEGTALTSTGFVVGSPGFLSPEQAMGNQVVPATDVFALGATLAFAANGNGPFGDGPTPALLYRVVSQEPDLSAVPDSLREAVRACLAKDPAHRPTPAQLVSALSENAPAFTGGWLPPAVLADIAGANSVLTGVAAQQAAPTAPATLETAPPQGFGPPTPPPFAPPQYPPQAQQQGPQQGQQGYPPAPSLPPGYPPAYPGPQQGQAAYPGPQQGQQQGQPQQGLGGAPTRPLPPKGSGLSRRGLLGLVGGGVVVIGGAATAFALGGGSKPKPGPAPSPSSTGGPSPTGSATPAPSPSTAPTGGAPVGPADAPGTLAGPVAKPLWTKVLNDTVYDLGVSNGTVVAVCTNSTQGLKTSDGTSRWPGSADVQSGTISTLPLLVGDTGYLVGITSEGTTVLLVVDLASGDTKWSLTFQQNGWELQGAYGIVGSTLLITANTTQGVGVNGLWAVDINTHQTLYTKTGSYIGSLLVPSSGSTVVSLNEVGNNGVASGIDAATGARTWSVTPASATFGGPGGTDGCLVGNVFYTGGNEVNAYDVATGHAAWQAVTYDPENLGYYAPNTDGQGRAFVCGDNTLYCFNPANGTKLWQTAAANGFSIGGGVVAANGMVYVVDEKGVLYAVNAATGVCNWSYTNPAATGSQNLSLVADSSGVYFAIGTQLIGLPTH